MSLEYRSEFQMTLPRDVTERILAEIADHQDWIVIASSQSRLRLRSAKRQTRPVWPEDVTVFIDSSNLDLVSDGATREEREELIRFIERVLRSHGIEARLREM
jgi:hypothetical protein